MSSSSVLGGSPWEALAPAKRRLEAGSAATAISRPEIPAPLADGLESCGGMRASRGELCGGPSSSSRGSGWALAQLVRKNSSSKTDADVYKRQGDDGVEELVWREIAEEVGFEEVDARGEICLLYTSR